ncbi:MAG: hypothetical protein WBB23_08795 [Desulforhopalus sp.]
MLKVQIVPRVNYFSDFFNNGNDALAAERKNRARCKGYHCPFQHVGFSSMLHLDITTVHPGTYANEYSIGNRAAISNSKEVHAAVIELVGQLTQESTETA